MRSLVWLSLLLCARAAAQQIDVPASFTIGNQRVGVATAPIDLLVQNTGGAVLRITGLSFSGTNAADFTAVSNPSDAMPIVVPVGATKEVQFTFKPGAAGPRTAALTLKSNDPMRPMAGVTMLGTGVVAGFALDRTSVSFGRQRTAGCTAAQYLRITNNGTDDLQVSRLEFEGPGASSFSTKGTPFRVRAGGSGFVDVAFCPRAIGMISASFVISTDYMPGHKARVSLDGTAFGPALTVMPTRVDFGEVYAGGQTPAMKVEIKNIGDDATTLASVGLTGPDVGQFRLTAPPANSRIAAGASLSVDVTASLTDDKPHQADLVISLAEELVPGKAIVIPVTAKGIVSSVSVTPTAIDCGTVVVGAAARCKSDLTIRNTGMRPLEGIALVPTTADFRVESMPQMIAPMQSAQVGVEFKPVMGGPRNGLLGVRAKGLLGNVQVSLAGRGQAVLLQRSPTVLDFGGVEVGKSATRRLIVENLGDVVLPVELAIDPGEAEPDVIQEFSFEPQSGDLVPGEATIFMVQFTPRSEGERTVVLQIRLAGTLMSLEGVDVTAQAHNPPPPPMESGCSIGSAVLPGMDGPAGVSVLALVLLWGFGHRLFGRTNVRRPT